MLLCSVEHFYCYIFHSYSEGSAECFILSVVMQSVITLSVIILCVFILSSITLRVMEYC